MRRYRPIDMEVVDSYVMKSLMCELLTANAGYKQVLSLTFCPPEMIFIQTGPIPLFPLYPVFP